MALIQDIEPPSSRNELEESSESNKKIHIYRAYLAKFLQYCVEIRQKLFLVASNFYNHTRDFFIGNRFVPHYAIILLFIIVFLANLSETSKAYALSQNLIEVDPELESNIVSNIDYYTTGINADAMVVERSNRALALSDGFVNNMSTIDTQITAREEPLPDNSTDTVYYIVRNGDTLTGLGWKFGVKMATLKYLNDIDNINSIKPGFRLKVPPKGYEVSASLIAQKENAQKAKLAAANRSTSTGGTSRQTYNGTYDSDGYISLIVPVSHNGISRGFSRGHSGIDYRVNVGTPVRAAASGVVILISTGWSGGYGNEIVISHGGGVATRYAHLSRFNVSTGQTVSQGDVIGYSGNSGRSTGPHLHFEEIINGRAVPPF